MSSVINEAHQRVLNDLETKVSQRDSKIFFSIHRDKYEGYSDDDFDPTKMENLVLLRQTPLIKVLLRCFENSKLFTECDCTVSDRVVVILAVIDVEGNVGAKTNFVVFFAKYIEGIACKGFVEKLFNFLIVHEQLCSAHLLLPLLFLPFLSSVAVALSSGNRKSDNRPPELTGWFS